MFVMLQIRNGSTDPPLAYVLPVNDDEADVQPIDFPTILFLDPGLLQHGQVEISQITTPVPPHILHLLGDLDEIRRTAATFFGCIHLWMPFVSKKRFYELYLRPSFKFRPDVALLLLTFKLITTLPPKRPRNPRSPLYHAAKHFYLEVEGSSVFSVPVLQAGMLLCLYELGHAIYPSAFLSIGACAHYAHALGINGGKTSKTRKVLTLVEVEERRSIWWAIVILDRFISIGSQGRLLSTAEPKLDDLLPADDAAWDQGIVRPDESFTLSSPMTGHMSKFALLCQAARLLSQVLHAISSDSAVDDENWMQLDRTLQSMLAASLNVDVPDNDQITFIYSALLALHTSWIHPNGGVVPDTNRTQHSKDVVQQITEKISVNLVENQCLFNRNFENMPPWGVFFAYRICVAHLLSGRETPKSSAVVKTMKETLLETDARWNAAGAYLQLLEAQEIIK
ncbi:hypothetical protein V501_08118 [Pseudogymnoascus sp. VKM F-4519 (FW-2642)]|nr:hypothetical protein V501_08118 [Pseudogymnoascus sp. VKM F-4519 (FW-2642)]